MIFTRENAGKWVASKNGKVVEASRKLKTLLLRVEKMEDQKDICFDKVPPAAFAGSNYGI